MIEVAVFVVVSVGFAYLSRACLLAPRSHGFHRFFAWESVLALVLLNARVWFRDPFSLHQIVSWLLLIASIFLVVHGVHLLRLIGKPTQERVDQTLVGFERTTSLVTAGAYRYIRHPLYSSLLFLAWGAFLKDPSWPGLGLALCATLFLFLTARVEEGECILYFGPAYETYMKRTRRFVPFLF